MDLRLLGTTDLEVSQLCLGTMQFGWTADEVASFAVMDAFVEAGGNFLDTADVYSRWAPGNPGGVSEEIVGRWLKARGNRDSIVVATKLRGRMWEGRDGEGLSRSHIMRAAEDSLRRLQVDTIDLYQCHSPDDGTPIEETLAAFDELIGSGKVRRIGASNYNVKQFTQALEAAGAGKLPAFVSLQPHYNLVHRSDFEDGLAELCERSGVGVVPYSPLAAGFLTGKYQDGQPMPKSQRAQRAKRYMTEQGFGVISALEEIAKSREADVPAVALAWLLARPGVSAPIVGANTPEQLGQTLPAAELDLTDDEVKRLDVASAGM